MVKALSKPVVVVAPDSFKGSLSGQQVAEAIGLGIRRACPDADIRLCPMADGGEGTLDAMLLAGGSRRTINVRGAAGVPRVATIGLLNDGSVVIETAEIVGITDADGMAVPVTERDTRGLGQAIRVLLDEGWRRFYVALGGSSTNDGGAGLLVSLGLELQDADGNAVEPIPSMLRQIRHVNTSGLDARLKAATIVAMSDVNNPLTGHNGATAVFGPQKGVAPEQIKDIDAAILHFATLAENALCTSARETRGAGAAGGLGFALRMLGAEFKPGAEVVAEKVGLDAALVGADWLITGEGRSDMQTLHGKAPLVACKHARQLGVDTSLLSGSIDPSALSQLSAHFRGCFSPAPGPISLDDAIRDAADLLANEAEQLARMKFGSRA
ncbi:glycerate kinase [Paraburkholderia hospita]|uniref:Glycerate kinase n=1 Tax=Paraburkholderia hospita TaxID=169430 RepID=A0ABN0FCS7_9BURK|nr:glycerate kinase [Paraburkholderia hospita]EIM96380.1 glycerate kinase [Paraburkholderia hospita]OUL70156.1 glycerate kinase [Paraburkholderia hospita]